MNRLRHVEVRILQPMSWIHEAATTETKPDESGSRIAEAYNVTSETTFVFTELIKRGHPCNKTYINVSTESLQNMH
jgi:hypothetical protein